MFATILAVLLAGDAQAVQQTVAPSAADQTADTQPQTPPPGPPASLAMDVGWAATQQADPYGRSGITSFRMSMPLIGVRLRSSAWYAELSGQLMYSSLTNRNITASVRRDLLTTGSLRWGLGMEIADVRFRRDDFRSGDILIGTNRTATIGMGALTMGTGSYHGASLRVMALAGLYQNRYGSLIELPGFSGDEPLADDEVPIMGGQLSVDGVTLLDRIELGGTARYLTIPGTHSPSVPSGELSGSASLNVRLFRVRGKQLYVGAFARFGPSGPSIIADKTFGLRGTWKLR